MHQFLLVISWFCFSSKPSFLLNATIKGTQLALGLPWPGHLFSHFEKSSPQPEIEVHLEIHFSLRSVLLDFQLFTEKPVFECAFAHPMILFLLYVVKNSMDRVSVICKLAKKWYLMCMCSSWLCPFKAGAHHKECATTPIIPVPAFSQTHLFLVWIYCEFRPLQEPQWPITSTDFIISLED